MLHARRIRRNLFSHFFSKAFLIFQYFIVIRPHFKQIQLIGIDRGNNIRQDLIDRRFVIITAYRFQKSIPVLCILSDKRQDLLHTAPDQIRIQFSAFNPFPDLRNTLPELVCILDLFFLQNIAKRHVA